MDVMIIGKTPDGKLKLSRKAVLVADGVPPPAGAGASDGEASEAAAELPEVGRTYRGCRIATITTFGAFVEVRGRVQVVCFPLGVACTPGGLPPAPLRLPAPPPRAGRRPATHPQPECRCCPAATA